MNRIKYIVIVITSVVFILFILVLVSSVRDNYRFGLNLYYEAIEMAAQTQELADSIDLLEKEFEKPGIGADDVNRDPFDSAIYSVRLRFGIENLPFLDEVRAEWSNQFTEFYRQTQSNEGLENTFHNEEIYIFRDQLKNLTNILADFYNGYVQIPHWERYFVPWNNVRNSLSEQARINRTESAP